MRKQFQKSIAWDTGEIHKLLSRFALCFPHIGFSWVNDDVLQFAYHPEEDEIVRIQSLLGEEFFSKSLSLEVEQNRLKLVGRIGLPSLHRTNKTGQHLFINQRSVTSSWFSQKVLEAYGTRLNTHRFPVFVLHLSLPPSWIDVNVHPQKREVRLRKEDEVGAFVKGAIENALEAPSPVKSFSIPPFTLPKERLEIPLTVSEPEAVYRPSKPLLFELPTFQVIGQVKHYYFLEDEKGIRVVDGFRATERILYEQLVHKKTDQTIQNLLMPIQIKKRGKDQILLEEHLEKIQDLGISIRHFGGDTFLIDAIPALFEAHEIPELIDHYLDEGKIPVHLDKCIKGRNFQLKDGSLLVKRLFQCHNPDLTPSGKMIHYLLDENKIEKLMS